MEDYFSRVVYTGGHDLSAVAVFEGQVDLHLWRLIALIMSWTEVLQKWKTTLFCGPQIPQDPFVVNGRLCPELVNQIQSALALGDNEEGRQYSRMSMPASL